MNIDTMPAGREMDALVAEKVMGLKRHSIIKAQIGGFCKPGCDGSSEDDEYSGCSCNEKGDGWKCKWCDSLWHSKPTREASMDNFCRFFRSYSTDIAAAWEVVEKIGGMLNLTSNPYNGSGEWRASFNSPNPNPPGYALTAQLAICRAALKAVGHGTSERRGT